jgi:hypothetical protein
MRSAMTVPAPPLLEDAVAAAVAVLVPLALPLAWFATGLPKIPPAMLAGVPLLLVPFAADW